MQMRGDRPNGSTTGHGGSGRARPPEALRRVCCVLWTPRGVAAPVDLESELDKKGIGHVTADNAHAAMAMLCLSVEREPGAAHPLRVIVLVEPEMLLDARALLDAIDRYAPDAARWVYRRGANPTLRALVESDVPHAAPVSAPVRSPVRGPVAAQPGAPSGATGPMVFGSGMPRAERRPLAPGRPSLRLTDHPPVAPPVAPGPSAGGSASRTGLGAGDDGLGDADFGGSEVPLDAPDARIGQRSAAASSMLTDEELAMLLGDPPPDTTPPHTKRLGKRPDGGGT